MAYRLNLWRFLGILDFIFGKRETILEKEMEVLLLLGFFISFDWVLIGFPGYLIYQAEVAMTQIAED